MRVYDLTRLALKNMKGVWAVLPALGFAAAAFCLCFAGAVNAQVQQEKSQPYEVTISAQSGKSLSDADVFEISIIEDVTAATPVLELPVTVKAGDFKAELTLTGMDAAYLEGSFAQGGAFPDDTVMPYIVLNEAACKLFKSDTAANSRGYDEPDASDNDLPDIDWLNAGFFIQTSEGTKAVTCKVCGILAADEEKDQEPQSAAFISVASAKALLSENGQSEKYKTIRARIKNIGSAKSVSKGIAALGLAADNSAQELQAGWNIKEGEMTYLLVTGGFCLICAAVLTIASRRISLLQHKEGYAMLRWAGMKNKVIRRLFIIQSLAVSLVGIAAGILVSVSLPSFLPQELQATSAFTLSAPFSAVAVSVAICVAAGLIPLLGTGTTTTKGE